MFAKAKKSCYFRLGIGLVEILIATACMSIIMVPLFMIFHGGSQNALKGLVKAEITVEARTILNHIHNDLKHATFFIDYSKPISETTDDFFNRIVSGSPNSMYTLLRFPQQGEIDEAIDSSAGAAYRKPIRITYELKREEGIWFSLYRQVGTKEPVKLSDRVNFLEIYENPMAPPKTCWMVNLQLADASAANEFKNIPDMESFIGRSVRSEKWKNSKAAQKVQIADFFTVVASEYYSGFKRSKFIANWHTIISSP